MKFKYLAAAALVASIPAALLAQQGGTPRPAAPAQQQQTPPEVAQLNALENAWLTAQNAKDRGTLEQILDPNFTITFLNGSSLTREGYINYVMRTNIPMLRVRHDAIRLFGNTAVVIDSTDPASVKFTWVAVRMTNGQWRVVNMTYSRVPPPPAAAQPQR